MGLKKRNIFSLKMVSKIVALRLGYKQKDCEAILKEYLKAAKEIYIGGDDVRFLHIGTLTVKKCAARKVYVNSQGKIYDLPEREVPHFRISSEITRLPKKTEGLVKISDIADSTDEETAEKVREAREKWVDRLGQTYKQRETNNILPLDRPREAKKKEKQIQKQIKSETAARFIKSYSAPKRYAPIVEYEIIDKTNNEENENG
jgi:Bacterial nucleoid DNA-binding protein